MSRICDGSIGRNERNSDAPAALNMFPKFDDVAIRTYLSVLAKIRRALHDPVGEHAEVLLEQHDVRGVLGDVGGGFDRDADVRGVQRDRVVDAVAEERDVGAGAPGELDDARLLVGADAREHRRVGDRRGQRLVVEPRRAPAPVRTPSTVDAEVAADLGGDGAVVAGDHLHRDAELGELGDRRAGIGLGPVDEGQKAGQPQVVLVAQRERGRLAGGDGHDPRAVGEQLPRAPPRLRSERRRSERGPPPVRPW